MSKFIANILKTSTNSQYNTTSSFEFSEQINQINLPEGYIIASLDVVSLFTNVPRHLVTRNIINMWNNINTNINLDLFLEMVEFCMTSSYFQYQGQYYQQTYGTAMGSSLSPILADIVLESIISAAINTLPFHIPVIRKYVDDLFISFPKNAGDEVLKAFNQQEERLQFTIEYENNGQLPYLDMMVIRNDNQQLKTQWYSKPVASGRMLHYNSFHHIRHKLNTINNFIHRVNHLSTNINSKQRNQIIYNNLQKNGYPKTLISRLINKYTSKKLVTPPIDCSPHQTNNNNTSNANYHNPTEASSLQYPETTPQQAGAYIIQQSPNETNNNNPAEALSLQPPQTPQQHNSHDISKHLPAINSNDNLSIIPQPNQTNLLYLPMPFIPVLTDRIIKQMHQSYPNIRFATKQHHTVSSIHTRLTDPKNKNEKTNIIYKIDCLQCPSAYIGMTTNKLSTRLIGHKSNVNKLEQILNTDTNVTMHLDQLKQRTALVEHCIETQHRFDFTNTQILDQCYQAHTLSFLEMCHVKTNTTAINKRTDVDGLNTAYAAILDSYVNLTKHKRATIANLN